jgi:hypothetical protein
VSPDRLLVPVRGWVKRRHVRPCQPVLRGTSCGPSSGAADAAGATQGPVTEHVRCFIQRERVKNSLKRRCATNDPAMFPLLAPL